MAAASEQPVLLSPTSAEMSLKWPLPSFSSSTLREQAWVGKAIPSM